MKFDVLENYSELNLLLRLNYPLNDENVFVDVGAYRGGFSFAFAKRDWRVIAFEPESTNYIFCSQRTRSFPKVTCVNKAVSEVTGKKVPLYVDKEQPGRNSLKPIDDKHHPGSTVETIRLEDALREHDIERVTVLKTDTEGADYLCLKSFDFEQHHPEIIMVEFFDERSKEYFDYTHHDMVSYLDQYGYTAFVSELGPLERMGSPYQIGVSRYQFQQISPYPLDVEPLMGNIIFVSSSMVEDFENELHQYLEDLERYKYLRTPINLLRLFFVNIPFGMRIFYFVRRLLRYRI